MENDISKVEYELVDHSQKNKGGDKRGGRGGKGGPKGGDRQQAAPKDQQTQ